MNVTPDTVCIVVAIVMFVLAFLNVSKPSLNWTAGGFAALTLTLLV